MWVMILLEIGHWIYTKLSHIQWRRKEETVLKIFEISKFTKEYMIRETEEILNYDCNVKSSREQYIHT